MTIAASRPETRVPLYAGLRLTADEYFALPDDGFQYELVNGVLLLSPSPAPKHQSVLAELIRQISSYVRRKPVGQVFPETDLLFPDGQVYRPELVFIRAENVAANWERIRCVPDLAVEIASPQSREYDRATKKPDYERYGVTEMWLIDPDREAVTFQRLEGGRYLEVPPEGERFASAAIPGFVLDLAALRRAFRPSVS